MVLLLAGCGGDNAMMMMNPNAPLPNQPAAFVQSDTQVEATKMDANLTCLGTFKDPAGPTAVTPVNMTVKDFEKSTAVTGATVEVYTSLADFNAKKPAAMAGPTAADGKLTLMMPAGFYRVIFRTTADPAKTIETVEFNRTWDDKERVSVSIATKGEIPGLVSVVPDDTKGVVAGDMRDCDNKRMGGLLFNVTLAGSNFDAKPLTFYFLDVDASTTVPARSQKWTSGDGIFATLNVPAGDATLEARGLLKKTDTLLTKLSSAVAPVRTNAITVVQLSPLGSGM
jgi:hypothetical protein